MQLRKVCIQGFRNFANVTIAPFPAPAVVLGENGVGKSNLLHALRLVLDPGLSDRRRQLQPDDIHDGSPSLAAGVEVLVEVELTDFDGDLDACSELDGAIVGTEPLVARLTYLFRPKATIRAALGEPMTEPLTPEDYEWTIFGGTDRSNAMLAAKRYVSLSVLPALRDAEGDLERADRSPLTRLLRELPPEQGNVDRALKAMQAARDELGKDPNVRKVRRILRARTAAMAGPQLDLDLSLAFAGRPEDLLRSVRLFVDAASTRGVDSASTGAANVIYLALLLERLGLRRRVNDGEDTLLAVEEPEAHLHPTLQRHVFAHLLSQHERLVLTTHSPHIAAVTPLQSVVLVSESDGNSNARIIPPGLLTEHQTADLERYLNVTRAEILFARHVVLVEGAAESYLLPAIANAVGFDLDGYGVVLASVEGTDFVPYARLLGSDALDRPFVVLTDGDITDDETTSKAEPGLLRAKTLLEIAGPTPEDDFATQLDAVVAEGWSDGEARPGRKELVSDAADGGIYVGLHTLEVDISGLFADEMTRAFNELASGPMRQRNFATAVYKAATSPPTEKIRDAVLPRIERIGKGRYAQRLAAHVASVDLRARVTHLLGFESDAPVDREDLFTASSWGPILVLLHDLRIAVQGLPLLPTKHQLGEWHASLDDEDSEESPKGDTPDAIC